MRKQDSCVRQFFRSGYSQKKAGIRAVLDERDEKLGYKIREAQMKKYRILLLWEIKSAAINLYMYGNTGGKTHLKRM